MATTLQDTDLFITERSEKNYSVPAKDLRDFVGVFEPGTNILFNNSTPPLGWVNIGNTNTNLSALRIVKTGGGTTGGPSTGTFNVAFGTHTIKAAKHKHAVTESNHNHSFSLASHSHGVNDPGHVHTTARFLSVDEYTPSDDDSALSPIETVPTPTSGANTFGISTSTTGITIANKSVSFTSGNNGNLGISVNNSGSTVNWNFNIKYNDFIVCQKSNY